MNWRSFSSMLLLSTNIIVFFVWPYNAAKYVMWKYPEYHKEQRNLLVIGLIVGCLEMSLAAGLTK